MQKCRRLALSGWTDQARMPYSLGIHVLRFSSLTKGSSPMATRCEITLPAYTVKKGVGSLGTLQCVLQPK